MIFKSTISPEQINETAIFLHMLIQISKNKKNETFWLVMDKIGCSQSGFSTIKMTVFQEL